MTRRPQGVLAPIATPFLANGTLDEAGFASNARALMAFGLHGIVTAGSNGEAPLLDEAERERLVELARDVIPQDRWLVAGAGGESTRQTITRAKRAAERGADAILVASPHYYGPQMTAAALQAHFTAVADASPIPVILYNIPKYVHFAIPPEVVAALAPHQNVAGIKDSSGDPAQRTAYLAAVRGHGIFLTGAAQQLADAVLEGASGGILGISQVAPALTLATYEAAVAGDAATAIARQSELAPAAREIVGQMAVPGLKAALDAVGLVGGAPRPPLQPLDAAGRGRVRELLASIGAALVPA